MRVKELLDEVDRRGFLKGLGAAALAGSGVGAKAKSYDDMDQLIQDKGLAPKPAPEAPDDAQRPRPTQVWGVEQWYRQSQQVAPP